jgi:transforming growth factor-beta-induced protein
MEVEMRLSKSMFIGTIMLVTALAFSAVTPLAAQAAPTVEYDATIMEILRENAGYSTLVAAIEAAGLEDALSGSTDLTLFGPTNDAFDAALGALGLTADQLLADTETLTSILLYHVAAGKLFAENVVAMDRVEMLDGNYADVMLMNGGAYIENAQITRTDINVSNGVIHVIDAVILPPTFGQAAAPAAAQPNIMDILRANSGWSTLVAAIEAAGLEGALSGSDNLTLFGPTNEAFDAALGALGITAEQLLADTDTLTSILLYHVAAGELFAADVVSMDRIKMLDGNTADVMLMNGDAYIENAQITRTDIDVSNGVVHVIDAVILPPNFGQVAAPAAAPAAPMAYEANIMDILRANSGWSTLVAAIEAAGLEGALSGHDNLTVFAPTNEAFAAALDALGLTAEQLLADTDTLTAVLLYHVAPGKLFAADVVAAGDVEMLDGNTAHITVNSDRAFIDNAQITRTDIHVSNGVIHVIDAVILPPIK